MIPLTFWSPRNLGPKKYGSQEIWYQHENHNLAFSRRDQIFWCSNFLGSIFLGDQISMDTSEIGNENLQRYQTKISSCISSLVCIYEFILTNFLFDFFSNLKKKCGENLVKTSDELVVSFFFSISLQFNNLKLSYFFRSQLSLMSPKLDVKHNNTTPNKAHNGGVEKNDIF